MSFLWKKQTNKQNADAKINVPDWKLEPCPWCWAGLVWTLWYCCQSCELRPSLATCTVLKTQANLWYKPTNSSKLRYVLSQSPLFTIVEIGLTQWPILREIKYIYIYIYKNYIYTHTHTHTYIYFTNIFHVRFASVESLIYLGFILTHLYLYKSLPFLLFFLDHSSFPSSFWYSHSPNLHPHLLKENCLHSLVSLSLPLFFLNSPLSLLPMQYTHTLKTNTWLLPCVKCN